MKHELTKAEKLQRARERWEQKQDDAIVMLRRSAEELAKIRRQLRRIEKRRELEPSPPDGVALTSMEHPQGLVDKVADAIMDGKLKLDDGLDVPTFLDRNKKLQAMADPRAPEKKAQRREVEKQIRQAELTGKRRKLPLSGKAAMEAILGEAIYGKRESR